MQEVLKTQFPSVLSFIQYLGLGLSEMTDECLAVLRMCCSSTVLQALEQLVSKVRVS